jgi:hypothetical protein
MFTGDDGKPCSSSTPSPGVDRLTSAIAMLGLARSVTAGCPEGLVRHGRTRGGRWLRSRNGSPIRERRLSRRTTRRSEGAFPPRWHARATRRRDPQPGPMPRLGTSRRGPRPARGRLAAPSRSERTPSRARALTSADLAAYRTKRRAAARTALRGAAAAVERLRCCRCSACSKRTVHRHAARRSAILVCSLRRCG